MGTPKKVAELDPLRAKSLPAALVLLIHESGKSQRELAEMLTKRGHPLTEQAISSWVRGKPPSPENLRAFIELMADLCGADQDALYREVGYLLFMSHADKTSYVHMGLDLRQSHLSLVDSRTQDS